MKNIREAVRDIIAERVVPGIERDGISKLILPEQITPDDCIKAAKCNQPCPASHQHDIAIGLTGKAPFCIDKKAFIFTPGRIVLLPVGTSYMSIQKTWWRTMNINPNRPPSILWLMVYPFGVRVQVLHIMADADAIEASQPYVLLGQHFSRLTTDLLEEVRTRPPDYAGVGRCLLMEFIRRCLRSAAVAYAADMARIPARRRPRFPNSLVSKSPRRSRGRQPGKSAKADSKQPSSRPQGTALAGRIRAAREFILSNYHTPIGLDDIADAAHTSTYHFSRQFKTATGTTPIQYLTKVRMAAAKELLLTDMKVLEVAKLVGIEDAYYFSRFFRRNNGISPLKYRQKMAKAVPEATKRPTHPYANQQENPSK